MNGNQYQNQLDIMNIIDMLSLFLAVENLWENRQQSAANDVTKANQQQAHYLLDEIKRLFQEQNELLTEILGRLED